MLDYRETTSRSQDMMNRIHNAAEARDLRLCAAEGENPSVTRQMVRVVASLGRKLLSKNAGKTMRQPNRLDDPLQDSSLKSMATIP